MNRGIARKGLLNVEAVKRALGGKVSLFGGKEGEVEEYKIV